MVTHKRLILHFNNIDKNKNHSIMIETSFLIDKIYHIICLFFSEPKINIRLKLTRANIKQ